MIVGLSPGRDQRASFGQGGEQFTRQAFITEATVEALRSRSATDYQVR